MIITPLIQKALDTAARLHAGQTRKTAPVPYIVHPVSVAWLLSDVGADEATICAGLLHDILEDVLGPSGYEQLEKDFGKRIADIVVEVSEKKDPKEKIDAKATWLERKQGYLTHLKVASTEAVLVSAADKIHNLESMIAAYKRDGAKMFEHFNAPADKKLWQYEQVSLIVAKKLGEHPLAQRLAATFREAKSLMQ